MSAVVMASTNNPLRAVTVTSNDFDIDGGRRLSGIQAAAFIFAQGLRSIQTAADYNQAGVSDRSRASVRPPNPPFPANTAAVTIDQFAERIKELYGVDPLIEFSAGIGLDGYSIADINRIVDQINREFDFDLAPLDAQVILGAQSTVSDAASDARVSAVRVLTRSEVEGAARDGHLESGNVYVDRHGSFFLDGAQTSPVEISLALRTAAHDNISGELATLLGKVAQRAQDSGYAEEVKSSVDEILEANPVDAPSTTQFEKISAIINKLNAYAEKIEAGYALAVKHSGDEDYYGSTNVVLFDLQNIKSRTNAGYDLAQEVAQANMDDLGALNDGWGAHWVGPDAVSSVNGRGFDQIFKALGEGYAGHVLGATYNNQSGDGKMPRDLAKAIFATAWGTDCWNAGRDGQWGAQNTTWDRPDRHNFRSIMGLGTEDTWTKVDEFIGGNYDDYPTVGLAMAMEELKQADASLVPAAWSSGTGWSISQLKTYLNSTLSTAWSAKAQAYDDYQRGVTSSTDVLASSTGTTAQQAAYKQLQAEFEKVKAASGESGLIARLLQGAGQSTGKVIGGASTDSTTQVSFTRAQLQEIAAALGSVRERSLKDNEQDQIKMQKLNGLLTQNIEAMSALVKAFEQLTQSLVQSLKR